MTNEVVYVQGPYKKWEDQTWLLLEINASDNCPWSDILHTGVNDGQRAHPVVFTTGCAKLNVVSTVVVDTSLGQHGVILDFWFSVRGEGKKKKKKAS